MPSGNFWTPDTLCDTGMTSLDIWHASLDYMAVASSGIMEDDQQKFVSNVSHDFRSPLTSIKGYVEAMARWYDSAGITGKVSENHCYLRTERLTGSDTQSSGSIE